MGTQSNQEVQGLLSPFIRHLRLRQVAKLIGEDEIILDLACGGGYLANYVSPGVRYYGVDRIPFGSAGCAQAAKGTRNREFFTVDLLDDTACDQIATWLPQPPTVITMIAFLEHIQDPIVFVERFSRLLADGGSVIGTTPHPAGRKLHDWLSSMGICSRDGAEEHERFLARADLAEVTEPGQLALADYRRFLLGLNQLFVYSVQPQLAAV